MCTSHRNRCEYRGIKSSSSPLILLSAAFLLLLSAFVIPVSADVPNAVFYIADNGSLFSADIEIWDTDRYNFIKPGMLGEEVPRDVSNVALTYQNGTTANYTEGIGGRYITFERGNYTVSYTSEVRNNNFQFVFKKFYNTTLYLPQAYDVRNPLIGYVSTGGNTDLVQTENMTLLNQTEPFFTGSNETVSIIWTQKSFVECRFYDAFQVRLLEIFGSLWLVVFIAVAIPYLMNRRKREQ